MTWGGGSARFHFHRGRCVCLVRHDAAFVVPHVSLPPTSVVAGISPFYRRCRRLHPCAASVLPALRRVRLERHAVWVAGAGHPAFAMAGSIETPIFSHPLSLSSLSLANRAFHAAIHHLSPPPSPAEERADDTWDDSGGTE
jgi:hypothetical protein